MDDVTAAILLKIAVEHNEQLKAEVKQVDLTTNPKGLEDLLVQWWRRFEANHMSWYATHNLSSTAVCAPLTERLVAPSESNGMTKVAPSLVSGSHE